LEPQRHEGEPEEPTVTQLGPGARLGPYQIEALLGAGGMGQVYRARDTRLDRAVAIKISREQFGRRFEREARAISALNHPQICTLYDVGPNYLVMELVEGVTLSGEMKGRRYQWNRWYASAPTSPARWLQRMPKA
jgi:serine/threonine protein kinase